MHNSGGGGGGGIHIHVHCVQHVYSVHILPKIRGE